MDEMTNDSPVGRLLEEISWEGNARDYRMGGRGRENVLVTEVFQVLDLLPRDAFLGEVLRASHGSEGVSTEAASEIENAVVDVLPGGPDLAAGGPNIQPDAYLRMPSATVLIEAKRIRHGSFQLEQLAREYLTLMRDHTTPCKLLLLILPAAPPIPVRGAGRLTIGAAITGPLPSVHAKAADPPPLDHMLACVDETCAWITWAELVDVVTGAGDQFRDTTPSVAASVGRMTRSITRSVAWHT